MSYMWYTQPWETLTISSLIRLTHCEIAYSHIHSQSYNAHVLTNTLTHLQRSCTYTAGVNYLPLAEGPRGMKRRNTANMSSCSFWAIFSSPAAMMRCWSSLRPFCRLSSTDLTLDSSVCLLRLTTLSHSYKHTDSMTLRIICAPWNRLRIQFENFTHLCLYRFQ